jgi:membrane-associated protease RseP (regulator of RpoE activity)
MRVWPSRRSSPDAGLDALVHGDAVHANGHGALAPRGEPGTARPLVNLVLFLLTCLTTLLAGTAFSGSPTFDAFRRSTDDLTWVLSGVPFAATLLGILVVHEFGHYFTARRHGASVSLPFFIPAPPFLFMAGTLGAIIRLRSAARDRNEMFDIAVAGPLAGLAVAVPAAWVGLAWSTVVPAVPHVAFGESLLTRLLVWLRFGSVPDGMMVFTHPVADAAWFGFLVTAINLLPAGQLDGGRIAYAVFGHRHGAIGRATVTVLVTLGLAVTGWALLRGDGWLSPFFGLNWFVLAALIRFFVGYRVGPVLDALSPPSGGRRLLGLACLLLIFVMLPPVFILPE